LSDKIKDMPTVTLTFQAEEVIHLIKTVEGYPYKSEARKLTDDLLKRLYASQLDKRPRRRKPEPVERVEEIFARGLAVIEGRK
jgi:hypothetical protein